MGMTYADRVRETSTSTGTGTLTLDGPVTGFRSFVAGAGNGSLVFYCIKSRVAAAEWEIGIGTVTDASSDTLARNSVIASSNAGNKTVFSAGVKDVILTLPADLVGGMAVVHKDVRVATTTAGTLASAFANGQNVDGIVLAAGDRILIRNQASAIENGVYLVQASGAPVRAFDLFTGFAAHGAVAFVQRGTANAGKCFRCTSTPGSDVVGTNTLTWSEFGAGVTAHASLTGLNNDDHTQYVLAAGTRPFTGTVGGVTPSAASDLATKGYVDSTAASLKWKSAVRVATTANGTLATAFANGQTVDGITLATSDRVLLKDQSTGAENGIYVVAASGAPTRASDLAAAASAAGAVVYVTAGTANANKAFVCSNASGSDTVGTNALVFVLFNSSGGVTAHNALTGLSADDHNQYLLTTGTRVPTGDLTIGAFSLLVTQQGSNPIAPASTKWKAFFKSDGLYVIDASGTVTGPLAGAGGLPVLDTTNLVKDPADTSKQMRIDAGAIAAATTRVLAMGDRDVDLAAGGTFAELSHNHAASAVTSGTLAAARGGLAADASSFAGLVTMSGGVASYKKANFAASAAPTVNDDTGSSYAVGSIWIDTTNHKAYVCLDASAAAAIWTEITFTAATLLPVTDSTAIARGSSDSTKQVRLEVDGLTTATTRVITVPDRDLDLGTAIVAAGTVAFAADQSLGTHKLTNLGTPSSSTDAANKSYVDTVAAGLDVKLSVRVATTANGTLATAFANGQTVDGVTLATGNRILLKNQTTQTENGVYLVAASGAPARASDMASGADASGDFMFVEEGTANGGKQFACSSLSGSAVVGTNNLSFTQYGPGVTALASLTDVSLSSPANGDMLYYTGSAWAKISAGTSGYFLKAAGAAIPTWSTVAHANLTGLSGDDHTQYFLADGSRNAAGDFNLNNHNVKNVNLLNLRTSSTLTLASHVATITQTIHKIDTEASAASDTLTTLNGGNDGDLVMLLAANSGRTVKLHPGGNIQTVSGLDELLSATSVTLLQKVGSNWCQASSPTANVQCASSYGTFVDGMLAYFGGTSGRDIYAHSGILLDANNGFKLNYIAAKGAYVTDSDGATITVDWNTGNFHEVTLGATGRTLAFSNAQVGQQIKLLVKQDGTGSRTITTWPTTTKWAGAAAPTLTTTASRWDLLVFECVASNTFIGAVAMANIG